MFTHVVLFNLTKPEAAKQVLDDARRLLAGIPSIRFIDVGTPAGTPRDTVDSSYDVGLVTVFDDVAGHDAYQVHPLHLEFVARNKASFAKVRVFDSI